MTYVLHIKIPEDKTSVEQIPEIMFEKETDETVVTAMVQELNEVLEKHKDILYKLPAFYMVDTD